MSFLLIRERAELPCNRVKPPFLLSLPGVFRLKLKKWTVSWINLLASSSVTERRGFFMFFVERIEVDDTEAKVYYTIPMPPYNVSEEAVEVSPFVRHT